MPDTRDRGNWTVPDWSQACEVAREREWQRLQRWANWRGFHAKSPLILRRPEGSYVVVSREDNAVIEAVTVEPI